MLLCQTTFRFLNLLMCAVCPILGRKYIDMKLGYFMVLFCLTLII